MRTQLLNETFNTLMEADEKEVKKVAIADKKGRTAKQQKAEALSNSRNNHLTEGNNYSYDKRYYDRSRHEDDVNYIKGERKLVRKRAQRFDVEHKVRFEIIGAVQDALEDLTRTILADPDGLNYIHNMEDINYIAEDIGMQVGYLIKDHFYYIEDKLSAAEDEDKSDVYGESCKKSPQRGEAKLTESKESREFLNQCSGLFTLIANSAKDVAKFGTYGLMALRNEIRNRISQKAPDADAKTWLSTLVDIPFGEDPKEWKSIVKHLLRHEDSLIDTDINDISYINDAIYDITKKLEQNAKDQKFRDKVSEYNRTHSDNEIGKYLVKKA